MMSASAGGVSEGAQEGAPGDYDGLDWVLATKTTTIFIPLVGKEKGQDVHNKTFTASSKRACMFLYKFVAPELGPGNTQGGNEEEEQLQTLLLWDAQYPSRSIVEKLDDELKMRQTRKQESSMSVFDVVVYYAGHGCEKTGDWVQKEETSEPGSARKGYRFTFDEAENLVKDIMKRKQVQSCTIVSDCCKSGKWLEKFKDPPSPQTSPPWAVIAACGPDKNAYSEFLSRLLTGRKLFVGDLAGHSPNIASTKAWRDSQKAFKKAFVLDKGDTLYCMLRERLGEGGPFHHSGVYRIFQSGRHKIREGEQFLNNERRTTVLPRTPPNEAPTQATFYHLRNPLVLYPAYSDHGDPDDGECEAYVNAITHDVDYDLGYSEATNKDKAPLSGAKSQFWDLDKRNLVEGSSSPNASSAVAYAHTAKSRAMKGRTVGWVERRQKKTPGEEFEVFLYAEYADFYLSHKPF